MSAVTKQDRQDRSIETFWGTPGKARRLQRSVGNALVGATVVLAASLGLQLGCQSRAGTFCQSSTECRPGLFCSKPPGNTSLSWGVCEPAKRGAGETCARTIDCSPGLTCGGDTPPTDGRYSTCQPSPVASDGGAGSPGSDLATPPDLAPPPDLTLSVDSANMG